jgi:uncharacterized protein (DUF1810 family)
VTSSPDPHQLQRFVDAQVPIYEQAWGELRRGKKVSHWMWFIFPQVRGLGTSEMAQTYAIASRAEASAYLEHPTLGPRLRDCTRLVNQIDARSLVQIFGTPDDMKFRSSMTLFLQVALDSQVFLTALEKYCGSQLDARTLQLLT